MPIIELPDGSELEMPDNPNPQEIARFNQIREHFAKQSAPPQASTTPSAPTAPPRMPGPFEPGAMTQVPEVVKETGRVLDKAVRGGIVALPNAAVDGLSWVGEKALGLKQDSPEVIAQRRAATEAMRQDPISRFLDKTLFSEISEPKTSTGKFLGTVGEGAVSSLAVPGGFARPVLGATVGGASAGAGDLIYRNTENPLLAAGGAVGTAFLGGLAGVVKGTKGALAQKVAGDISEKDLRAGQQRMREMREVGVEGNLAQAMPDHNALETTIDRLADMSAGKAVQDQLMRQTGQAKEVVERGVANLPGAVGTPAQVETAMQAAATKTIDAIDRKASDAWKAIAKNEPTEFSESMLEKFTGKLGELVSRNSPEGKPNTAIADVIEEIKRKLYTVEQRAVEVPGKTTPGRMTKDGYVPAKTTPATTVMEDVHIPLTDGLQVKSVIEDVLKGYSPSSLGDNSKTAIGRFERQQIRQAFKETVADTLMARADEAFAAVKRAEANPARQGVTGRISRVRGANETQEAGGGRAMAILDKGVDPNAATSEVKELAKAVRSTPGTFMDLTKTWLSGKSAEASNVARSGQQPASFIDSMVAVTGDPRVPSAKSVGFRHTLEGIAEDAKVDPKALVAGWERAQTVLSDLTKRPKSITSVDEREAAIAAQGAASRVLSRFGVFVGVRNQGERLGEVLSRNAYEAMSQMLTTPEGVDMLIKLSRTPARSHAAVTALSGFLGTNAALNDAAGKE